MHKSETSEQSDFSVSIQSCAKEANYLDNTIDKLFEQQVMLSPNTIALVYKNKKFTYNVLNTLSNQLARYLIFEYQIKPGDLVALYLERNEYLLIVIIAVLKAGAAYVPIDSSYPSNRIKYILQDTNANLIICSTTNTNKMQKLLTEEIFSQNLQLLTLNTAQIQRLRQLPNSNIDLDKNSSDLAYIMYTSGTTGRPKGVLTTHRSVINCIASCNEMYDFSIGNTVAAFTSYVFDISVLEFFTTLFRGGTLHLLPDIVRLDPGLLSSYINSADVNFIYLPPALLANLPQIQYKALKGIIYGGEVCEEKVAAYWATRCKLYNIYGTTETTIHSSCKLITKGSDVRLIGEPILNTAFYVLDSQFKQVQLGMTGELFIAGEGISNGYLNQIELTKEKFILNPLQDHDGVVLGKNTALYKTGDIVRLLQNGDIEYIGRKDLQIKIHGKRIELGEIQSVLSSYPGITQSIVIVDQHGVNSKLVGYYVAERKIPTNKILNYLKTLLPSYMIPTAIVYVTTIPLSVNGKIDKSKLPRYELNYNNSTTNILDYTERIVLKAWSKILMISENQICIDSDFYSYGGDSISAMQLAVQLRNKLRIEIRVEQILKYNTIKKFCNNVINKLLKTKHPIMNNNTTTTGLVPLLPIQKWFLDNKFHITNKWHPSFSMVINNADLGRVESSLIMLVKRHGAFRLKYKKYMLNGQDQYEQYYDSISEYQPIKTFDVRSLQLDEGSAQFEQALQAKYLEWQKEIDLERGIIYSYGYIFGFCDKRAIVFFSLHHLIVDAVSWNILADDLEGIYNDEISELRNSSYKEWGIALKKYYQSSTLEKDYWQNISLDMITLGSHNLQKFIVNYNTQNYSGFRLSNHITEYMMYNKVLRDTHIHYILLTALGYAIYDMNGQKVNYITFEGHGRSNILKTTVDITQTIGWFTALYPLKLEILDTIQHSIEQTKNTFLKVPNSGLGFGMFFGYDPAVLPKISFNYLGQLNKLRQPIPSSIPNLDYNTLYINSYIIDNNLCVGILSKMNKDNTDKFTKLLHQYIIRIITTLT